MNINAKIGDLILELERTGRVVVRDFGTFKIVTRPARKGRNPRTGEAVDVPERRSISFRPSRTMRDAV